MYPVILEAYVTTLFKKMLLVPVFIDEHSVWFWLMPKYISNGSFDYKINTCIKAIFLNLNLKSTKPTPEIS